MKAFFRECRRRQVFQVGGLYLVGAWVVLQVAALAFDNWGLPGAAMRYVWGGAAAGLPIALLLGWRYDLAGGRLLRTGHGDGGDRRLERGDYLVLGTAAMALLTIAGAVIVGVLTTGTASPTRPDFGDVDPKSIAVLPFDDMSPDGSKAYLSNGVAEELLNWLSAFRDLKVTSRTSSAALGKAGLSVPEIASELGVAYVLEGSVRSAGETTRITAQLIDGRTDTHVWSATYEFGLDNAFDVYDQVAARIARELKATLRNATPVAHATDPATYELYLLGRRLLASREDDDLGQAVDLFERVVSLDPDFAPGHAALAEAYFWGGAPGPDRLDRIRNAAEKALALDNDDSEALAILGRNYLDRGNAAMGRELLDRAVLINPNNALAYRWLGQSYASSDPARYVALAQQAYLRDPLDATIHWHQATSLRLMGRTDDALAVLRKRLRFYPDDVQAQGLAAQVHLSAGHLDGALKSLYVAYRLHPDYADYEIILDILGWLGELDLAEAWLHEIVRRFGNQGRAQAIVEHLRGHTEAALRLVAERVEHGEDPPATLAFVTLRFTHDLDRTRPLLEQHFRDIGKDPTRFDPEVFWFQYIDYALILERAGEHDVARNLIRDIKTHVARQIDEGVKFNISLDHTRYLYAELLAIAGDTAEAVAQLRVAFLDDGFPCIQCLGFPHFDSIRDDPGFIAVRDEVQKRIDLQRGRLADEGMLLRPEDVIATGPIDFDPFAN